MYLQRCLTVTWLVPHETAAISARSEYTIQPCTMSRHFMQSHIRRVHACLIVTCHLHFWQNHRDLFTCYCGNTCVTAFTQLLISACACRYRRLMYISPVVCQRLVTLACQTILDCPSSSSSAGSAHFGSVQYLLVMPSRKPIKIIRSGLSVCHKFFPESSSWT